ncbi:MAG: anti-sigma factor antagonist [Planctomycetota bacterium]|nr:MAG: anti-sigma factor antagonist [Planctomycetota bacterium]
MALQIQIDEGGERPFVTARLVGPLSAENAPALLEALYDPVATGCVAVDLSGVTAMDSAGLGILIQLAVRARTASGRLLLVAPQSFVQGVLEVTHLDDWFEVFPSLEAVEVSSAARRGE